MTHIRSSRAIDIAPEAPATPSCVANQAIVTHTGSGGVIAPIVPVGRRDPAAAMRRVARVVPGAGPANRWLPGRLRAP